MEWFHKNSTVNTFNIINMCTNDSKYRLSLITMVMRLLFDNVEYTHNVQYGMMIVMLISK